MSTDWGIGCRTCKSRLDVHLEGEKKDAYFSGEWDNCRDLEGLRTLIAGREAILATQAALGCLVSFSWSFHGLHGSNVAHGLADFLAAHAGHELAPMNEYGRFDDQCYKRIECACCGSYLQCVLQRDHEGDCSPKKK